MTAHKMVFWVVIKIMGSALTAVSWCQLFHCEPEYRAYTKYDDVGERSFVASKSNVGG